jgi:hypothetical protein
VVEVYAVIRGVAGLSLGLCVLVAAPVAHADPDPVSGRSIIEASMEESQPETEFALIEMTITNNRGQTRNRRLKLWLRKKDDSHGAATLMRVLAPREVKRFGVLVLGGEDRSQWIYLPNRDRLKRIAGQSGGASFVGSDFTYEDLDPGTIDESTYSKLADVRVDGELCHVVEARPVADRLNDTVYGRRKVFIRKDGLVPVRVELFDKHDKLVKVQTSQDLVRVDGLVRPRRIVMKDLRTGGSTELRIETRDINPDLPDRIFTKDELRRGG